MYYKEIESSKEAKQQHDANLRRVAADRARKRQEYNRIHRAK